MAKMKSRKPLHLESSKFATNIYSYADSINKQMESGKIKKNQGFIKGI